jgi:ribA/ribD-fused uncharacterized protein
MKIIDSFSNEYQFLSNFYNAEVVHEGITYKNSEAAFQAAKTKDISIRNEFSELNPSQAKLKGRHVELREDWEQAKDNIMYEIVKDKFSRNSNLRSLLMKTNTSILIEGNWWHDNYWGDCHCEKCQNKEGKNTLGLILMRVRDELRNEAFKAEYMAKWGK